MNFDNYKFRCSQLGLLMTNGRGKNTIGQTAISALRKIYLKEKYGREEMISSKYMEKGNLCEDDSMDLLGKHLDTAFFKNKKRFDNDYLTGNPDIITPHAIYDTKTSWDLFTFDAVDKADPAYEWQLLGYMALTGVKRGVVAYCLVDTPDELLQDELNRLQYQLRIFNTEDAAYKAAAAQLTINHKFEDIPVGERVKMYDVPYSEEKIEQLYARLKECRELLNSY